MDDATQEGSGCEDHGFCGQVRACCQSNALNCAGVDEDVYDVFSDDFEIGRSCQHGSHTCGVGVLVALSAVGTYGRPFAGVEYSKLDPGVVSVPGHFTTEGIQLKDEVRLGDTPDGGIAGHGGHGVSIEGQERGAGTKAGRGEGGFATGVACADDDYLVGGSFGGG